MIPFKPKEYVTGESFTYPGKNYRLKLTDQGSEQVKLIGGRFVLGANENLPDEQKDHFVRDELVPWYRVHAAQRLKEKTERYSRLIDAEPRCVSVKEYKTRWGSCSNKGEISYNWRIIIAPHRIVDYVVVHEIVSSAST